MHIVQLSIHQRRVREIDREIDRGKQHIDNKLLTSKPESNKNEIDPPGNCLT